MSNSIPIAKIVKNNLPLARKALLNYYLSPQNIREGTENQNPIILKAREELNNLLHQKKENSHPNHLIEKLFNISEEYFESLQENEQNKEYESLKNEYVNGFYTAPKAKEEEPIEVKLSRESQIEGLKNWLNYLDSKDCKNKYSTKTRYLVWHQLSKLKQSKDKNNKIKFDNDRKSGDRALFPELNTQALDQTLTLIENYFKNPKSLKVEDKEFFSNMSISFSKIYAKFFNEEINRQEQEITSGIWNIFSKGDEEKLTKLIESKGSDWCFRLTPYAESYLKDNNKLLIYFDITNTNEYIPKIGIQIKENQYINQYIDSIQGEETDQDLTDSVYLDKLQEKLIELTSFKDFRNYISRVENVKKINTIEDKLNRDKKLNLNELLFLSQEDGFDSRVKSFRVSSDENKRFTEIKNRVFKNKRELKEKIQEALKAEFNYTYNKNEIAFEQNDITENTKLIINPGEEIKINYKNFNLIKNLEIVIGNLTFDEDFMSDLTTRNFNIKNIVGNLKIWGGNPVLKDGINIYGDLIMQGLTESESVKLPNNMTVNGRLDMREAHIKNIPKNLKIWRRFNYSTN